MLRFVLHLKPWIGMEPVKCMMTRPIFGHVTINPCSLRCRAAGIRIQRYTTEHVNVSKEQSDDDNKSPLQLSMSSTKKISDVSLDVISKPVPFNTHQLVCRLQSRGSI